MQSTSDVLSRFHDHDLQKVMALFLLTPDLYSDHRMQKYKQTYFFNRFYQFAKNYNTFSDGELCVYFGSVRKESAGEANVCGGAGKMSHASKKYFKDRYASIESNRNTSIDNFAKKYKINLAAGTDERLFLGVREIWNHLDRAAEIVQNSQFPDVLARAYSDATLTAKIPPNIVEDKTLVPLDIRARVLQKHQNSKRKPIVFRTRNTEDEEAEEDSREVVPMPKCMSEGIVFVRPPELDDEDW
jgi:hypothetical protein